MKIVTEYFTAKTRQKNYRADVFIPEKNLIIEYYKDYWHCNPKKYKLDYWNKRKKKFACEIWTEDFIREQILKEIGYEIIIVWESDFKNNEEKIINQLVEKINNNS